MRVTLRLASHACDSFPSSPDTVMTASSTPALLLRKVLQGGGRERERVVRALGVTELPPRLPLPATACSPPGAHHSICFSSGR